MEIGARIKELRLKNDLTQEELADRCELTKGYISQLENDVVSPSIATLKDILDCLGCALSEFFEQEEEQIVFPPSDTFEKENDGCTVRWLVPTSLKNAMEPILVTLSPGGESTTDLPHDGEEFGYVLSGKVELKLDKSVYTVRAGESFYFRSAKTHSLRNPSADEEAAVLWVTDET